MTVFTPEIIDDGTNTDVDWGSGFYWDFFLVSFIDFRSFTYRYFSISMLFSL